MISLSGDDEMQDLTMTLTDLKEAGPDLSYIV